jgi:hypothetical protein
MTDREPDDGSVPRDPAGAPPPAPIAAGAPDPVAATPPPPWVVAAPGNTAYGRPGEDLGSASASSGAHATAPEGWITAAPADPAGGTGSSSSLTTRRRVWIGAAGAGAAAILVGAGFLAGHALRQADVGLVAAQQGPASAQGQDDEGPGGPFGQGRPPGDPDGDGNAGPGAAPGADGAAVAFGQITAVSGSTLTLRGPQGSLKVTTTSATTVAGKAGGDLSGLSVGQLVIATGTVGSDGTLAASSVMTRADRAPGGAGDGVSSGAGAAVGSGGTDT